MPTCPENRSRRRPGRAWGFPLAVALASLTAWDTAVAEPGGVEFGSNRARGDIETVRLVEDTDDFVARLMAGERLSVTVSARRKSGLLPDVTVIGPDGRVHPIELRIRRGGKRVSLASWPIFLTGLWTVRIGGRDGTQGAYTAKFKVKPPPRVVLKRLVLDGPPAVHEFDGLEGCSLSVKVTRAKGSAPTRLASLTDPGGSEVLSGGQPVVAASRRKGSRLLLDVDALSSGDGAYALTLVAEDGPATYDLLLRIAPPPRPKGRLDLDPEPRLEELLEPARGRIGSTVRLGGANFSLSPAPRVRLGESEATVVSVANDGSELEVVVPSGVDGAVVSVTVINPDGQIACAADHFEFVGRLDVESLSPIDPVIGTGRPREFTVTLTGAALAGATRVTLATTGGVGTVPQFVDVAEGELTAPFTLQASGTPAVGTVSATLVTTVQTSVTVELQLDISGWRLEQTSSVASFTFPAGTVLRPGDYVVIGRNTGRSSFEAAWAVQMGSHVTYFDSRGRLPLIDGGESFSLYDDADALVDGPTVSVPPGGGVGLTRTPGAAANDTSGWSSYIAAPASGLTPGSGQQPAPTAAGLYVSEFSDALGQSGFNNEFVELYFDPATE